MNKFKKGDIIKNPWASHKDVKIGIYLGENKETYQLLLNIKGKWSKRSFYKTSTINPQEWEKLGHTNGFDIIKEDLNKHKSYL